MIYRREFIGGIAATATFDPYGGSGNRRPLLIGNFAMNGAGGGLGEAEYPAKQQGQQKGLFTHKTAVVSNDRSNGKLLPYKNSRLIIIKKMIF